MTRALITRSISLLLLLATLPFAPASADDAGADVVEIDANEAERSSASEGPSDDEDMIELDANQEEEEAESGEQSEEDLMAEISFGDPVSCITTSRIRRTEVLSDREILFVMSASSETYLNRLPYRCPRLRMSDAFSYEVRGSQLCDVDVIRVVDNFGGTIRPGAACGLGPFLPVAEEQIPLIREQAKMKKD